MFLSKSTAGIYQLYYEDPVSKKRRKISTGKRLKGDAIEFLRSFTAQRDREPEGLSLSKFITEFLPYAKRTFADSTYLMYKEILDKFLKFTGDVPITQVSSRHVDLFMSDRLKTIKAVSANIEFRVMKAAFNTALRWELLQSNPFTKCQAPRPEEKSPRYFSKEDFHHLMDTISELWLKNVVWFALFTGMRRSEIINLRWSDLNVERRTITIESSSTFKTKAGKRRTIPISDGALYLLRTINPVPDIPYVFTLYERQIKPEWLTHRFKHYCIRAGLKELHFHNLRTSFASWLVMSGVEIYSVSKLLGHSSVVITEKHYAHLKPQTLVEEVNMIRL